MWTHEQRWVLFRGGTVPANATLTGGPLCCAGQNPQSADGGLTTKLRLEVTGSTGDGTVAEVAGVKLELNAVAASDGITFLVRGVYLRSGCKGACTRLARLQCVPLHQLHRLVFTRVVRPHPLLLVTVCDGV